MAVTRKSQSEVHMKALVCVDGRKARRRVDAESTCSQFFVVTPSLGIMQDVLPWTLTHKASGWRVAQSKDKNLLRKFAGILGALPVRWARIRTSKGLKRNWEKLPIEVQKWRVEFYEAMRVF